MEYVPTVSADGSPAPIPWTFSTWLANFAGVDLPIGDLARDVAGDDDFPDSDNVFDMADHLISKKNSYEASAAVREALLDAWNYFKASTHPVGDHGPEGAKYRLAVAQELGECDSAG